MRRVAVAMVAVTLMVAACGDDGGGSSSTGGGGNDSQTDKGKAYVAALTSTFEGGDGFTDADAECLSAKVVDVIGVDRLEEAGLTPENITDSSDPLNDVKPTEAEADQFVDGVFECVDFGKVMIAQMVGTGDSLPIPEDKLQCVGDEFEKNDTFRQSLKANVLGLEEDDVSGDELTNVVLELFDTCGVSLADLAG